MRWHTKPITQLVVMFVVMSMVIGAQSTASALLTGSTKNTIVAKNEDTGLRKVAGNFADPTCPNTDAVAYAYTENRTTMAPPRRLRYVDAQWEYDSLNTNYFRRTNQEGEFAQAGYGTKAENLRFQADDPLDDMTASTIMSSMFRYKPTAFKDAYVLKYSGAPQGPDTPHKGSAPAIEVPSKAGWPVCMPTTGYDIGGGYEAMVVFVDSNRITLHIGIHEYMDGDKPELGSCPIGLHNCRGGYWLYISGINIDSDIVSAYNSKKGVQQGGGLSSNITDRIQLPVVKPGRRLGTSQGDGVTVLLRDSGPIIYANKNFMWGGGFPEYDPGGTPTSTPPTGSTATPTPNPNVPTNTPAAGTPTNTPIPGTPTSTPTVTLTLPPDTTATPTPSGGATPTPAPTGPDIDEPTAGSRILHVFVSSSCTVEACARLRELMNNIQQGLLEGDNALLVWQINGSSEWNVSRTTAYQYWEENNGNPPGFNFTIIDSPNVFPLMNEVQTLLLQITQSGSTNHYFLK